MMALPPRCQFQGDAVSYVVSILLILVGLTYAFYGYHLFFTTLFLSGFLLATNVIFATMLITHPFAVRGAPYLTPLAYFGISSGCGFVLGGLAAWFWSYGMYTIGLLGGYAIGRVIFSAVYVDMVSLHIILLVLMPGVMSVVQYFYERPIIISSTALAGAYAVVYGIDVLTNCGIAYDAINAGAQPSKESYGEVAGVLVLFALAFVWQWWRYRRVFGGKRRKPAGHQPDNAAWSMFATEKSANAAKSASDATLVTSGRGGGGHFGVAPLGLTAEK